jgi:hypothetical protein
MKIAFILRNHAPSQNSLIAKQFIGLQGARL